MAKRREQNPVYEIDPIFYVPDEMDDYVYAVVQDEITDQTGMEFLSGGIVTYPVDENDQTGERLPTPRSLTIIEQKIRTLPNGTQVVDLIVEVEDVPGATTYEFRIDKA